MSRTAACSLLLAILCLPTTAAAQAPQFGKVRLYNFLNGQATYSYAQPGGNKTSGTVSQNSYLDLTLPYGAVLDATGPGGQLQFVVSEPKHELMLAPPAKTPVGNVQLSEFETELFQMINQARATESKPPLRISAALTAASRRHSNDMARTGVYDHIVEGVSVFQRMQDVGYQPMAGGENIAFPPDATPEAALKAWRESPPHWRGILTTDHTKIGVGVVKAPDRDGYLWTLTFAKPAIGPTAEAALATLKQTAADRLNKPTVLTGRLDASSTKHEGRYFGGQYYTFTKGRTYNLQLRAEFGAMMYMAAGPSAQSEQGQVQFDFTPQKDGEQPVMLITTQQGTTGGYTITVTPQ